MVAMWAKSEETARGAALKRGQWTGDPAPRLSNQDDSLAPRAPSDTYAEEAEAAQAQPTGPIQDLRPES
jgi:hypothetical protein